MFSNQRDEKRTVIRWLALMYSVLGTVFDSKRPSVVNVRLPYIQSRASPELKMGHRLLFVLLLES